MKKPSSRIREEIARLQDQLRQAETREAERIGRLALKAGLGEIEVSEAELQTAFEELAGRFRSGEVTTTGKRNGSDRKEAGDKTASLTASASASGTGEV